MAHVLEVKREYIKPLAMDVSHDLGDGRYVRLMDANHCPGGVFSAALRVLRTQSWKLTPFIAAAVLVFDITEAETGNVKRYVHCGDFRYYRKMNEWPGWKKLENDTDIQQVEEVMLDTTYCNARYKFPLQGSVIDAVGELCLSETQQATPCLPLAEVSGTADAVPRRNLYVVATYTIGKEKVLRVINKSLGSSVFVTTEKHAILNLLELDYLDIFVTDPRLSPVHVVTWGKLGEMVPGGWKFLPNWSFAEQYLEWVNSLLPEGEQKFTDFIGIVPTGWTWEFQKQHGASSLFYSISRPGYAERMKIYQVPYSEHSNFEELREFIAFLKPAKVIPTVVGSGRSADKLAECFRDLVDTRRRFRSGFAGLFGDYQETDRLIGGDQRSDPNTQFPTVPAENVAPSTTFDLSTSDPSFPAETTTVATATVSAEVSCPICDKQMNAELINTHLDSCLTTNTLGHMAQDLIISDTDKHATSAGSKRPLSADPSESQSAKRRSGKPAQTKLSAFFTGSPRK
ncbi:hypothetical protein PhCBS80983_g02876 [Powellomyces hirtus]|uniref:UBZ4-type domain-containing protein n=1 Tax=Powellomyces hirtus TaxID=109895 RepID=A0A507E6P8_9FUNG|nr:hypothetical protein PhCBS80983_g02876 [Powellomyces hirtus]